MFSPGHSSSLEGPAQPLLEPLFVHRHLAPLGLEVAQVPERKGQIAYLPKSLLQGFDGSAVQPQPLPGIAQ